MHLLSDGVHRRLAVVLVAGFFAAAGSAQAATVEINDTRLEVTAANGETNRLALDVGPDGTVAVFDDGAPLQAGPGCSAPDPGTVSCPSGRLRTVLVQARDGDDSVTVGSLGLSTDLRGGAGNDQLQGTPGPDALDGGPGNDELDGAGGDDTLMGGEGDDALSAGSGADVADGGPGVDVLDGDLGDDQLTGGSGDDSIDAGPGNDRLDGGDGTDELIGGDGADIAAGGAGVDRVTGEDGDDQLDGGADGDDLDGGPGADTILGGDGNDTIQTTDGADRVDGGGGDDTINGSEAPEQLVGGAGNDTINAYGGADVLDGGDGDDTLDGGDGPDALRGGSGQDRVSYVTALQGVLVTLGGGADDGIPGEGDDVAADIEELVGSDGDDRLVAGSAPAALRGGAGDDRLTGGSADDTLDGGDGDDVLDGAGGADRLAGGSGEDTASYAARRSAVVVTVGRGADDGGRGEKDDVAGDVERVLGGHGDDRLTALAGAESTLEGGPGDDVLRLQDARQSVDRAICGSGSDQVRGDQGDEVKRDCETVYEQGRLIRFGLAGAPSPALSVQVARVRLRADGRLLLPVFCSSATYARCRLTVRITRKYRMLGRGRAEVGRGRSRTLRLRLRGRQVALLRRAGGGVTVRLRVSDGRKRTARAAAVVSVRR